MEKKSVPFLPPRAPIVATQKNDNLSNELQWKAVADPFIFGFILTQAPETSVAMEVVNSRNHASKHKFDDTVSAEPPSTSRSLSCGMQQQQQQEQRQNALFTAVANGELEVVEAMAEEDVTVLESGVGRAGLWRSYRVRLNQVVQQQLNLEHQVKTCAINLFKTISRILEDFDADTRTNTKLQDILGQYSMVNLELFNIVDEIKKVSKSFVVHPKNVNVENASILLCSPQNYSLEWRWMMLARDINRFRRCKTSQSLLRLNSIL